MSLGTGQRRAFNTNQEEMPQVIVQSLWPPRPRSESHEDPRVV